MKLTHFRWVSWDPTSLHSRAFSRKKKIVLKIAFPLIWHVQETYWIWAWPGPRLLPAAGCGLELQDGEHLCFPLDITVIPQMLPFLHITGGLTASARVQAEQRGCPHAITRQKLRKPRPKGPDRRNTTPPRQGQDLCLPWLPAGGWGMWGQSHTHARKRPMWQSGLKNNWNWKIWNGSELF